MQRTHLQIQMVFQNPYSSLNGRMRVDDIIAEPILSHRLTTPRDVPGIVGDLLDHVGFGRQGGRRYPHEFSGGQHQRISIVRALACQPRLLICDRVAIMRQGRIFETADSEGFFEKPQNLYSIGMLSPIRRFDRFF